MSSGIGASAAAPTIQSSCLVCLSIGAVPVYAGQTARERQSSGAGMATAAETKAGSVSKSFKKQKTPVRGATKVLRTATVHPDHSLASQSTRSL